MRFEWLPGGVLVNRGMNDIALGITSESAFLVKVGAPRLRQLGLEIPDHSTENPEAELYCLLAERDSDSAHSRYNALIRQLISFERALESDGR